jgi:hypothetical protein
VFVASQYCDLLPFSLAQTGGESAVVNMEYHKGSFCVYTSIFCQEGYCPGCEIYKKIKSAIALANQHGDEKSQKVPELLLTY